MSNQPPQPPPPPWPPPGPYPPGPPGPPDRRFGGATVVIALAAGLGILIVAVAAVNAFDGDGSSSSSPGEAATRFLDAINDGDRAAAENVLCDDALTTVFPDLDELAGGGAQISLQGEISESQLVPQTDVAGTFGGEQVEGTIAASQRPSPGELTADPDAPWCVSRFTVGTPSG